MVVRVTCRDCRYTGQLDMDGSIRDDLLALGKAALYEHHFSVRLTEADLPLEEGILIVADEDIVHTLVLHDGLQRYADRFLRGGSLQEYLDV